MKMITKVMMSTTCSKEVIIAGVGVDDDDDDAGDQYDVDVDDDDDDDNDDAGDQYDVDVDDDDIYIMMKCLSVCVSRKIITSSWESPVTT